MKSEFGSILDPDKVPSNLDEAVEMIKSALSNIDIEGIKGDLKPIDVHFGTGREIRNDWSLWDKETPLVKWFQKEYGIDHADDISSIILYCVWQDVRGEPRNVRQLSEEYKEYWDALREAEITGVSIMVEINKNGAVKIIRKKKQNEE